MHTIEHQPHKYTVHILITAFFGLFLLSNSAVAQMPQIPQIPAFLPTVDQVPSTQSMPLDGTWLVTSIGKKIRIQAGRAYAVDGWLHMFVLKVQPGMVVQKNITPTGPGKYTGEDLPLMGKFTATVQSDRSIDISVSGVLGQVNYKLIPVQIDNQQWFDQEMRAAGLSPAPSHSTQPVTPGYQPSTPPGMSPPAPVYQPAPAPGYGYPSQQPIASPPAPVYQPAPVQQPPQYSPPGNGNPPPVADCQEQLYDPRTGQISCAD